MSIIVQTFNLLKSSFMSTTRHGEVKINGKTVYNMKPGFIYHFVVNGNVTKLDTQGDVNVVGNVGDIDTQGDVEVSGNANCIETMGDVNVTGNVIGNIKTMGDVILRKNT
jgi:hypothetical protein